MHPMHPQNKRSKSMELSAESPASAKNRNFPNRGGLVRWATLRRGPLGGPHRWRFRTAGPAGNAHGKGTLGSEDERSWKSSKISGISWNFNDSHDFHCRPSRSCLFNQLWTLIFLKCSMDVMTKGWHTGCSFDSFFKNASRMTKREIPPLAQSVLIHRPVTLVRCWEAT